MSNLGQMNEIVGESGEAGEGCLTSIAVACAAVAALTFLGVWLIQTGWGQ